MSEISYYDFDLEEALISLEKVVNSLSKKSSKTQEVGAKLFATKFCFIVSRF